MFPNLSVRNRFLLLGKLKMAFTCYKTLVFDCDLTCEDRILLTKLLWLLYGIEPER